MGEKQKKPFQLSFNASLKIHWLLLAESHLTRRLLGSMVRRVAALSVPMG